MRVDEFSPETILDRMVNAAEIVRERMRRVTTALRCAGIEYAVVGGNAVAAWVASVDRAAVRSTQDVDVLIRRSDLDAVKSALGGVGFVHCQTAGIDFFLDGPTANPRDAVHVVFASELVRLHEAMPNPDVKNSVEIDSISILSLEALVQVKLTANRDKDRVHIRDLIGVGLVDQAWTTRLPALLGERLRAILDNPDG